MAWSLFSCYELLLGAFVQGISTPVSPMLETRSTLQLLDPGDPKVRAEIEAPAARSADAPDYTILVSGNWKQ